MMQIPKQKNKLSFHKKNRKSVRITVFLFILVHLAFFMTGFLSDNNDYTHSDFRTPQTLSEYKTVSLIRWDYSRRDQVMELVFDLKNTSYSEGNIEFAAVFDNKKNLDSQVVYNNQDMLIIQLYKVPEDEGKKVTITFGYTPVGGTTSETSFYSYIGIINEVDSLPVRSEDEYYLARQDYDIAYYKELIAELEGAITENETSIANIQQEIVRLQSDTTKLTTDELLNLNETIDNDKSRIEVLENKNADYRLKIASYQESIDVYEQRKADYEQKNR